MEYSPQVLVVDDEMVVRETLDALLSEEYHLYFAEDGIQGLALAEQVRPDVVLLDVMMPGMDGFEVCRRIRAAANLGEVPVILVTALDDRAARLQGLQAGADDFLSKPFDSLELLARLRTITRLNRYRRLVEQRRQLEELHQALLDSYHKTIQGWSDALDLRDKETEGHTQRVMEISVRFAQALGFDADELDQVRMGALLHDVGKLGIPDAILLKPASLNAQERAVMRQHPVFAFEWLAPIDYLWRAVDIPYCHHEKWDGSGYPRGLCGENIPLYARLFAIVDVWDALCSNRPYRTAVPEAEVLAYIRSEAGAHFDPALVKIFMNLDRALPHRG